MIHGDVSTLFAAFFYILVAIFIISWVVGTMKVVDILLFLGLIILIILIFVVQFQWELWPVVSLYILIYSLLFWKWLKRYLEAAKTSAEWVELEANREALRKEEEDTQFRNVVTTVVNQHIRTLATKRTQTIKQDAYGNNVFDGWWAEIRYFLDNVVAKSVDLSGERYQEAGALTEDLTYTYFKKRGTESQQNIDKMSPVEFEHWCAEVLQRNGWEARVTPNSGDQGIDVIATRGNTKAVLQCKKYSKPVGNAAVQQVIAGKKFEGADVAAVVSNATSLLSQRFIK